MRIIITAVYLLSVCCACVLLVACDSKKHDEQYFLTHPTALMSASESCNLMGIDGMIDTTPCETVMKARLAFSAMVEENQENPQAFGEQVIQLQNQLSAAKTQGLSKQQIKLEQQLARMYSVIQYVGD